MARHHCLPCYQGNVWCTPEALWAMVYERYYLNELLCFEGLKSLNRNFWSPESQMAFNANKERRSLGFMFAVSNNINFSSFVFMLKLLATLRSLFFLLMWVLWWLVAKHTLRCMINGIFLMSEQSPCHADAKHATNHWLIVAQAWLDLTRSPTARRPQFPRITQIYRTCPRSRCRNGQIDRKLLQPFLERPSLP